MTCDTYLSKEVELMVIDAWGDKYARNFLAMATEEGLVLVCPDCGEWLNVDADPIACANGHLAYTVIDPEATVVVNNLFRAE